MPNITVETLETIKKRLLDNMAIDIAKGEGSDLANIASAMALDIADTQMMMQYLLDVFFLRVVDTQTIDYAAIYGLTLKEGDYAMQTVQFVGAEGTVIPKETLLLTPTNKAFRTLSESIIDRNGVASVEVRAIERGDAFNSASNTLRMPIGITGIFSITHDAIVSGVNDETLEELSVRLKDRLKSPPGSGSKDDYRRWAMSVAGVNNAMVEPAFNGPGSVRVVCYGPGGSPLTQYVIDNVAEVIALNRPINVAVTVISVESSPVHVEIEGLILDDTAGLDEDTVKENILANLTAHLALILPEESLYVSKVIMVIAGTEGVKDIGTVLLNGAFEKVDSLITEKLMLSEVAYV